jgi:hypothetical protein
MKMARGSLQKMCENCSSHLANAGSLGGFLTRACIRRSRKVESHFLQKGRGRSGHKEVHFCVGSRLHRRTRAAQRLGPALQSSVEALVAPKPVISHIRLTRQNIVISAFKRLHSSHEASVSTSYPGSDLKRDRKHLIVIERHS